MLVEKQKQEKKLDTFKWQKSNDMNLNSPQQHIKFEKAPEFCK